MVKKFNARVLHGGTLGAETKHWGRGDAGVL